MRNIFLYDINKLFSKVPLIKINFFPLLDK